MKIGDTKKKIKNKILRKKKTEFRDPRNTKCIGSNARICSNFRRIPEPKVQFQGEIGLQTCKNLPEIESRFSC